LFRGIAWVIGDLGGLNFAAPNAVRCPCPLTILMLAAKIITVKAKVGLYN